MEQNFDSRWWKQNKNKLHESIFPYIRRLDSYQGYRQQDNIRNMRLYGNSEYVGLGASNFIRSDSSPNSVVNRVTLNIIQSMIDTVTSKITKNKPRPFFMTDGGDWSLQRRAEKLTQFAEGQFYATDFYSKAAVAFKDSCIFGTGCLKIFTDGSEIKVERVFIDEIQIDDTEAYYGQPRQMHQLKWVHKDVLKQKFPSSAGAIEAAGNIIAEYGTQSNVVRNGEMLLVVESWHLPSGPGAKDGKHCICINNETLFSESYDKDFFPFVFFRWNDKPLGFFGQGISEQLTGLQLEINKILRTIQVSMHLVSVPKIFVEASSKIVSSHLNNKIGGIIKYVGTPPTPGQIGVIPPELFAHLDRLYNRAYEIVGVSQLSAQSTKPTGLNSGKALRTYNDIETERFMSVGIRYEKAFMDASRIMIQLAKEISEQTDNYKVKVPGGGFLSTITWSDVEMDEDQYLLQVFPTNALSQNPSNRFQEVQELMQAGFLSKEDSMRLMDFPDLKAYYNMANAGVENIQKQIEQIVDKQVYQGPEPYQNLQYGLQKFQQAYLMYQNQNAPEEILEMLRTWMSEANSLLSSASNAVQQQQMEQQIAMQQQQQALAVPQAPPQSDLMPVETAGAPIA